MTAKAKAIAILAAAAAMTALGGCDRLGLGGAGAGNEAANSATNASGGKDAPGGNQAAAAIGTGGKDAAGGAVQASAANIVLSRDYIVGSWTDNGDCSTVTEFLSDGTFIDERGLRGLWNLEGDRLTATGDQTRVLRIAPIDQDTTTVILEDGSLGRSTRC